MTGVENKNVVLGAFSAIHTISIESVARESFSASTTDFYCDLRRGYNNIKAIKIQSAEIPVSWYAISRDRFLMVNDGQELTVELIEGNYDPATFCAMLVSVLNNHPDSVLTYNATYNVNTGKITVTANGSFTFDFTSINSPYIAMGAQRIVYPTDSTWTSTNVINLSVNNRAVYILLNTPNSNDSLSGPYNFKIPLNVGAFQTCVYTNNTDWDQLNYYGFGGAVPLKRINVKLVDYEGFTINNNGVNWSFTLTIYE